MRAGRCAWVIVGVPQIDEFRTFVRPVRHPTLSPFCTELTGITQADVDAAPAFPAVVARFHDWLRTHDIDVDRLVEGLHTVRKSLG